jgi:hypothetical protein
VSFFLLGAGPLLWIVSTTTLRQSVTPPHMLGRVSAIYLLASGTRSVGTAIGALVGGLYGAEACLVVAAIGFLAQALLILLSPVPRLARQPEMVHMASRSLSHSGGTFEVDEPLKAETPAH